MTRQGWVSLLCIAMVGCQSPKIALYDDFSAMQHQVTALVPAGTTIVEAKRMMRENGFDCVERQAPRAPDEESGMTVESYLDCEHSQMAGIFGHYHLTVQYPCTEDGRVGEAVVSKLDSSRGLAKERPVSDVPRPIEPAPLWTKVALGTGLTAFVVVMAPLALYGMAMGGGR